MRACTAVITEISFNEEDIPYRAEVEFIQPSEWEDELKILFDDLLDNNGKISSEHNKENTDAGVAYAKIRAVYPERTRDDVMRVDVQSMLQEVSHILGNIHHIREADSLQFFKRLQQYIDSKEKPTNSTARPGDKKNQVNQDKELWPLIKVVRLFVKSPPLSTGSVLVDLPGVQDSNAARAAVAENYLKQTTGLWIVAPITRAVDDKAARSLLGESFKRQLKMDGGFDSVTFICSKTDDISVIEAPESLGLEVEMAPLFQESDELVERHRALENDLKTTRDSRLVYHQVSAPKPTEHTF